MALRLALLVTLAAACGRVGYDPLAGDGGATGGGDGGGGPFDSTTPVGEPTYAGAWRYGSTGGDTGESIGVDDAENIYVGGLVYGATDFGGGPVADANFFGMFLASYSAAGTHRWSKAFDAFQTTLTGVAAGGALATGHFTGDVDFGGGVITNGPPPDQQLFVASFDEGGAHVWASQHGDMDLATDYAADVAVAPDGVVTMVGTYQGSIDFGGGQLPSAGDLDLFIASFAPDGQYRWAFRFGQGLNDLVETVAADTAGNTYFAGQHALTIDFGGDELASGTFLVSFDRDGGHRWSRRVDDGFSMQAVVDGAGQLVVVGRFGNTVDFGGGPLVNADSDQDVFLVGLDADTGAHRWSRQIVGTLSVRAPGLALDADRNIYLAGGFSEMVDFGVGPMVSAGVHDVYLASFDPDGVPRWSVRFGTTSAEEALDVAVGPSGAIYATGFFYEPVDFGGGPLTSAGFSDIFVLKLDPP